MCVVRDAQQDATSKYAMPLAIPIPNHSKRQRGIRRTITCATQTGCESPFSIPTSPSEPDVLVGFLRSEEFALDLSVTLKMNRGSMAVGDVPWRYVNLRMKDLSSGVVAVTTLALASTRRNIPAVTPEKVGSDERR
jgi:hypothetical protein